MAIRLATERLRLRDFSAEDFDAVQAYATDPEVVRFMPWGPSSEEDTRSFLRCAATQAGSDPRVGYELAVVEMTSGRVLATCRTSGSTRSTSWPP